MFVDLTAAYDTVWHRGLTYKLLRLLTDRHMVHRIMEMVGNRSFILTSDASRTGQTEQVRRLKNGDSQGSLLAPLVCNTYISDLPTTVFRKYAYAEDLTIMHAGRDWQAVEGVLRKDMATAGEYL